VKYRHSYHAGNFADVHKHVALLALLRALQRKDKGFLYLDTHAGAGAYELSSAAAGPGAEARHGVLALSKAQLLAEELRDYRLAVEAWQHERADARGYPGSPALAAQVLRPEDRGVFCELVPKECRALERSLGGLRRATIECGDGFRAVRSRLPSVERRALILIDPPYEDPKAESSQACDALGLILERQANAVVVLWYPIKDEPVGGPALSFRPVPNMALLRLELWVYPRDARVGLNGSGLLIANAPYRFAERAAVWQPELWSVLDSERRGGQSVEIVPAQPAVGASHHVVA
jgi:23S rRNA (adenine2030-N6)-methyltransferase